MKLRTSLFLIFGSLLLVLLLMQWWVFTHIKQEIRAEVSSTAFEVSRDTASAVILHQIKVRTKSSDKQLQEQRFEWHQKHPGGDDRDIFIELLEGQKQHQIKLFGPGLDERIEVSQKGLDKSFTGLSSKVLMAMISILLLALLLAGFFAHRLSRPLQNLARAAQQIGKGELGEQINQQEISGPAEVTAAIAEFNAMSAKLLQLEEHNRQLQNSQQLSELGEIARGFAHSLRNPLNTLGLAVDELADEELELDRKQRLNNIVKRQIERIDNWIKSFMALSSEGAEWSQVSISDCVDELVMELSIIKPGISWQLELENDCIIEGYQQELRTMLQVLLENAMEASGDSDKIEVSVASDKEHCFITICDEGEGFSDKIKQQLFTPKVTSKGSGAGMGLFITQRLAQSRYQGTLELKNREQAGVIAVLKLACKRAVTTASEEV